MLRSIFIFLFISLITTSCNRKNQGPSIRFLKTEFDLGTIVRSEGGIQTFDVYFDNVGSDTLVIESIKKDCESCTECIIEDSIIPPGEPGVISVTFDSREFFPQDMTKSIIVKTNDPKNQEAQISFCAKIR